jgi:hypothetical protein
MPTKTNPYSKIKREHKRCMPKFLSRVAFGPPTLRMFKRGDGEIIRDFFMRNVGCGEQLRQRDFEKYHASLLRRFPSAVRLSRSHKKPKFGHKAKVIDLYFKTLCLQREALNESAATKLQRKVHVPLDNIVLGWVWEHFKDDLSTKGLEKGNMKLSSLNKDSYQIIQDTLARCAKLCGVPAIWYDDLWLSRPKSGRG